MADAGRPEVEADADTETGADAEVDAEVGIEAHAEADAEAEVDADADAEVDGDPNATGRGSSIGCTLLVGLVGRSLFVIAAAMEGPCSRGGVKSKLKVPLSS